MGAGGGHGVGFIGGRGGLVVNSLASTVVQGGYDY
jgi:hypothetical protein